MALSCHCGDYGGHRRDCGYYEPPCPCYRNNQLACPIHGPLAEIDTPAFFKASEREQMPKASHQLREMEHISPEDYDDYLRVIDGALAVHDDRERKRKGLWKNYPPQDQLRQCKIKVERCLHLLEQDPDMDADTVAEIVAEGHDIINYAIFAVRKAQR